MRLSLRDFERWQDAVLALQRLMMTDEFDRALPKILLQLISAESFFLLEYKMAPTLDIAQLGRKTDPDHCITHEMIRYSERVFFTHPFSQYLLRTGDLTPLKISDFYNRQQFRNTGIFQNFYKPLGMDGLMAAVVFGESPNHAGCFHLARRRDFSESDRLLLALLRPHIQSARRSAEQWSRWTSSHRERSHFPTADLTPRESEIARWLAAGKTNPEIAMILQSKPRTVEKHVERILEKLRVENRTAAAVMLSCANRPRVSRERPGRASGGEF